MRIELLTFQTSKEPYLAEALQVYSKKLKPFCKFEYIAIKSKSFSRSEKDKKLQWEQEKLLSKIQSGDYVILFDERGETPSSEKFASYILNATEGPSRKIVLIIGGAYGVAEEVRSRANVSVSLSSMVFNHHVAQVVALEQIYRSYTILNNLPYHNA